MASSMVRLPLVYRKVPMNSFVHWPLNAAKFLALNQIRVSQPKPSPYYNAINPATWAATAAMSGAVVGLPAQGAGVRNSRI